jgi:hypothetical protein
MSAQNLLGRTLGIEHRRGWLTGATVFGLLAAAGGCSSSSNNAKNDAGSEDSGANLSDAPSTGISLMCGQLAALMGGTPVKCTQGMTCCETASFSGGISLSATCVNAGARGLGGFDGGFAFDAGDAGIAIPMVCMAPLPEAGSPEASTTTPNATAGEDGGTTTVPEASAPDGATGDP